MPYHPRPSNTVFGDGTSGPFPDVGTQIALDPSTPMPEAAPPIQLGGLFGGAPQQVFTTPPRQDFAMMLAMAMLGQGAMPMTSYAHPNPFGRDMVRRSESGGPDVAPFGPNPSPPRSRRYEDDPRGPYVDDGTGGPQPAGDFLRAGAPTPPPNDPGVLMALLMLMQQAKQQRGPF